MRWLPVALLATMLGIALVIEAVAYPPVQWLPKLPLAVLLTLPFVLAATRARRHAAGRRDRAETEP
ncbi:MAG: hypothetical protein AAGC60_30220 [Acidobacteriota bacterium]